MQDNHSYHPRAYYNTHSQLKRVMDALAGDRFCPQEHGLFHWIFEAILDKGDRYFVLADLLSYIEASNRAIRDYTDQATWARKAILNVARSDKFSSDRTIREYAEEIWHIESALQTGELAVAGRDR